MEPNTAYVIPFLHADEYYKGSQEDAVEFMTGILRSSEKVPAMIPLVEGTMQQTLRCLRPECQYIHRSATEKFRSLYVPLISGAGELFHNVQTAVDAYQPSTLVTYDMHCAKCQLFGQHWGAAHEFIDFPRVLVVALNRWAAHEDDGMIQHPVEATDHLEFRGVLYELYATVVHLGDSPKSGHYITIARHRTSDAAWWVYNDRVRVIATEEQRRTTCFYEGQQMKSYALLYEKHTP